MISIPELSFAFDEDGTVILQQTEDHEHWSSVLLHPCHLREIAEHAGLLDPVAPIPDSLARRLAKLQTWAASLQSMLQEGGADTTTAAVRAEFLADGIGHLLSELAPDWHAADERHDQGCQRKAKPGSDTLETSL